MGGHNSGPSLRAAESRNASRQKAVESAAVVRHAPHLGLQRMSAKVRTAAIHLAKGSSDMGSAAKRAAHQIGSADVAGAFQHQGREAMLAALDRTLADAGVSNPQDRALFTQSLMHHLENMGKVPGALPPAFMHVVNELPEDPISVLPSVLGTSAKTNSILSNRPALLALFRHPSGLRDAMSTMTRHELQAGFAAAVAQRYGSVLPEDHQAILTERLMQWADHTLSARLSLELRDTAVSMVSHAAANLQKIAEHPQQVAGLLQLVGSLTRDHGLQQRVALDVLQGLGLAELWEETSGQPTVAEVARCIANHAQKLREEAQKLRDVAPQNLKSAFAQASRLASSLILREQAAPNSYLANCVQSTLEDGQRLNMITGLGWAAAGVVAGVMAGVTTTGLGVGLMASLLVGAAVSGLSGIPGMVGAYDAVDQTELWESAGLMAEGSIEEAKRNMTVAWTCLVLGMVVPGGAKAPIKSKVAGNVVEAALTAFFGAYSTIEGAVRSERYNAYQQLSAAQRAAFNSAFNAVLVRRAGELDVHLRVRLLSAFFSRSPAELFDRSPAEAAAAFDAFMGQLVGTSSNGD